MTDLSSEVSSRISIMRKVTDMAAAGISSSDIHFALLEDTEQDISIEEIEAYILERAELIKYKMRQNNLAGALTKVDVIRNLNQLMLDGMSVLADIKRDLTEPEERRTFIAAINTMNGLIRTSLAELKVVEDRADQQADSIRICDLDEYIKDNLELFREMIDKIDDKTISLK